jgi:[NiFe] hydrogenase assembly HybE family chaperone
MNDAVAAAAATTDPGVALQRAFTLILDTRMRDLPLVNPALRVEAVGFRRWNGLWLGALVTPWFINLMLLPDAPALWPQRRIGEKVTFAFPAGRFEFIAGKEPSFGEYLSCSLFSPVFEFADHETARLAAALSLAGLFDEQNFEVPDLRVPVSPPQTLSQAAAQAARAVEASASQADLAACDEAAAKPVVVSKRDFLRGRWKGAP